MLGLKKKRIQDQLDSIKLILSSNKNQDSTEFESNAGSSSKWTQIAVLNSYSNIHKNRQSIMHHINMKINEID